jgi:uncharacterized membrane protein YvlD (DUF360 family)
VGTLVTTLVDGILVPVITLVTAPIAFLASSGLLLLVFAALWAAFTVALVREPARIEATWRRLRSLPLVVQALAWVLFLPVLAGIVVWRTPWPAVARFVVVGGIAGWNLLVFLPRPA